jgi:tetratricopeptide (TPR) repeat protein
LPISKKENAMYLRHESIAGWYFHEEGHESEKRREDACVFFMEFLKVLENEESKTFFIKVYRKREFCDSFLGDLIDDKRAEKLLVQYLSIHPEEIKGRTELGKVYQNLHRWEEAEKVLKEAISIAPQNIPTRVVLGRLYYRLNEWYKCHNTLQGIQITKINNPFLREEWANALVELGNRTCNPGKNATISNKCLPDFYSTAHHYRFHDQRAEMNCLEKIQKC